MTIVLNEHEWARDMIESRSLGAKPFETLSRVAKYYIDKDYSKKEVRGMLDTFLLQCEPTASLPKWSETLDYAVARALKYDAIKIDGIEITKPEMERIDALEGKQIRRYFNLNEVGMVQFSKKVDNTNVRVCFITPGETAMVVTDFRNLGYQYLKYHGEPYFECQNCGITVKSENATGRKQKYCKECAVEIHMKQTVNSVMRQRYKQ